MRKEFHFKINVDIDESSGKVIGSFASIPQEILDLLNVQPNSEAKDLPPAVPPKVSAINNSMGWIPPIISLENMCKELKRYKFLDWDFELIKPHFTGTGEILQKISWYGNSNELTYLF